MKYYDTIIIGGGASGLAAAVMAKTKKNSILIIEHNDRVGKKLLSTGNGKCNFTNAYCKTEVAADGKLRFVENPEGVKPFVSSADNGFSEEVISFFDVDAAIAFFKELGLLPLCKNGYYYPRSEQAASVLDLLRFRCLEEGCEIVCGYQPLDIRRYEQKKKDRANAGNSDASLTNEENSVRFRIDDQYTCCNLILAAGGQNAAKTGSDGSGYEAAKAFGHTIVKPVPALCGLKCSDPFFKELAGVRTDAELSLFEGKGKGDPLITVKGNLQMNSWGISGIPVFQMSLAASRLLAEGRKLLVKINFLPEFSEEELVNTFAAKKTDKMLGILNKKLAKVVLKESKKAHPDETEEDYNFVYAHMVRKFKVHPTETAAFEDAQTTLGGVSTEEIDSRTMESKLVPGLFFTGEIIDVSGICGGYNLSWAWATAHAAAMKIVQT
ncbi:MAG: aminoacetone oxidase family FAD-binding enzyme [Parasporobacterium sp.]|nr:aminoacetone oxidase family FAD-binding enzyme [Parasporobacterium sp.]